jgi:hypothetical protein
MGKIAKLIQYDAKPVVGVHRRGAKYHANADSGMDRPHPARLDCQRRRLERKIDDADIRILSGSDKHMAEEGPAGSRFH